MPSSIIVEQCSTSDVPRDSCGSATATCTCATSCSSMAGRRSSTASSSTTEIACTDVLYNLAFLSSISGVAASLDTPTQSGTATWQRPVNSAGSRCCRCSSHAVRRCAPRQVRRQQGCSPMLAAATSFKHWLGNTSRWRSASCTPLDHALLRSAGSQGLESPRWLLGSRLPWVPCLAPS